MNAPASGRDTADTNEALFERAQRVIPGGVNSPVRAFRSVGGTPYFVAEASGPFVYDVEGRRYIDYVQSYGPGICGHAHPAVIEAVQRAASRGTSYGAPTRNEVLMAEEMCARVEGLEMVRLTNSGTEAVMSAVRLARGVTGRPTVVKFAGCYHGHSDALLVAGGSGVAQQGLAGSEGVTAGAVADTIVAPYNVVPELDETVAVVCVEPVAANMGLVAPEPGFLQGLRDACDEVGALLLFDEVITGFRLCRGGAAAWFGVQPDIWCFGKVIGGGLPIGAFGASSRSCPRWRPWAACTRPAPSRAIHSPPPRASPRWNCSTTALTGSWRPLPRRCRRAWRRRSRRPALPRWYRGWVRCWACSSLGKRPPTSTRPAKRPITVIIHAFSMGCCAGVWPSRRGPMRPSSRRWPTPKRRSKPLWPPQPRSPKT